jgi:hypothetical protein
VALSEDWLLTDQKISFVERWFAVARMLEKIPKNWCWEHSSDLHKMTSYVGFVLAGTCTCFRIREETLSAVIWKWWMPWSYTFPFLILHVDLAHILASRDPITSSTLCWCDNLYYLKSRSTWLWWRTCNVNRKKSIISLCSLVLDTQQNISVLSSLLSRKHNQAK